MSEVSFLKGCSMPFMICVVEEEISMSRSVIVNSVNDLVVVQDLILVRTTMQGLLLPLILGGCVCSTLCQQQEQRLRFAIRSRRQGDLQLAP